METIRNQVLRGAPCDRPGKGNRPTLFDLDAYEAWRKSQGLDGAIGRPKKAGTVEMEEAKLRKELALAEKYELQTERERGKLINIDDHLRVVTKLATTAKNKLMGLSAAVAPRLVGLEGAEIEDALDKAVVGICEELSDPSRYRIRD